MFVAIWALNNIIAYKLLTAYPGVPSNSYRYQTTNNFEKLFDQECTENTSIITASILLVLRMHIELTRFLENNTPNAKFDINRRLRLGSTGLEWNDSAKIREIIIVNKDDKDEEKDLQKRNRQLKREKQCQKQVAKAKTCLTKAEICQQVDRNTNNNQNTDNNQDVGFPTPGTSFFIPPTPSAPLFGFSAFGALFLSFSTPNALFFSLFILGAVPLSLFALGAISFSFLISGVVSFNFFASGTTFFGLPTSHITPLSPSNRGLSFPLFVLLLIFVYLFFLFSPLLDPVVSPTKILMPTPTMLLLSLPLQCIFF